MRESARREPPMIGDPDLDIFIPSLGREAGRVRIIPSGDPGRSDRPGAASSDTSMDRGGVAMNQVEIEQSGDA